MNNTVREDLFNALNDLLEKQFQDFKWWLRGIDHNGKPNIPAAHLENTNQRDVADLLIQHYGEDALQVCIHVLQKSNINDVARKLEETLQKVHLHLQMLMLTNCQLHQPPKFIYAIHTTKPVENTMALTVQQPTVKPQTSAKIKEKLNQSSAVSSMVFVQKELPFSQSQEDPDTRNHVKEKFQRIEDPNAIPGEYVSLNQRYSKLIILDFQHSQKEREVEIQAIGMKHTEIISQRDKSSATIGTLFNRDKHGFIPQIVVEMNLHAESEKSSIAEIISKQWPRCHEVENVIPGILKNVKELLFIIDGFDELRKGREEYFCKFFGEENKDQATQAFRFVTQNDTLFTMCVIPLVSWIICTVIKQEMERETMLKKNFKGLKILIPGEYVSLNQRYSKLIILDFQHSQKEREVEIQAIGMKHTEIISQRDKSSATIGTLFNRDKHGFIPQIVVLQGAAGIGKTIMAKKIMLDWASKQIYRSQFFYAFYISCREMNLHAESEKSSIAEIISKQWPRCHEVENVIPGILKNVKELLFIIDGFDELRKGREEYFCKFFGEENKDQATQAFRFVTQNDTLFTMCVIPLVSWIICTVIKQEMERGMDLQKTPCTLTAIYMLYLSSLLKFHHKESKENIQRKLKSFCSLAAEGIRKKQILFMEEEVKKHSLDQEQSLSLFLNQNIFKRDIHCIQTFSFIHLSFQEFFAALFCVLEGREKWHSQNPDRNLQTLLQRHDIYFESVFAVGFRFLFGFLNEENRMKDLKKDFRWQISDKSKDLLLKWIKDNINIKIYKIGLNWITQDNPTLYLYNSFNKRIHFYLEKEMLSYLYETQDENFVRNALSAITEINYHCTSDMELMILAYCLQHCQNLEYLCIQSPMSLYQADNELFLPRNE
ncbi:hypothetical protein E2320_020722 [Naja naja]|nr:hypothetical protein E2320_020722 [Naja naja]